MLSSTLAIVTADTDGFIVIKSVSKVLKLAIKHLLRAKDIRRHEVHLVANHLATLAPDIALKAVVGVLITDVVGAHHQLLGVQW